MCDVGHNKLTSVRTMLPVAERLIVIVTSIITELYLISTVGTYLPYLHLPLLILLRAVTHIEFKLKI